RLDLGLALQSWYRPLGCPPSRRRRFGVSTVVRSLCHASGDAKPRAPSVRVRDGRSYCWTGRRATRRTPPTSASVTVTSTGWSVPPTTPLDTPPVDTTVVDPAPP